MRKLLLSTCLAGVLSAFAGGGASAAEICGSRAAARDRCASGESAWHGNRDPVRRLLLGDAGRLPACCRRGAGGFGLYRRRREHRAVRDRQHGNHRARKSLKITYDPATVSYGTLLRIFVSVAANPTELDYQGPDHGPQYRSVIWLENPEQRKIADAYLQQLTAAHTFDAPIVTQVATAMPFYPAEAYHQNFATLHPDNPYIAEIDAPKVTALAKMFPTLYRASPSQVRITSKG